MQISEKQSQRVPEESGEQRRKRSETTGTQKMSTATKEYIAHNNDGKSLHNTTNRSSTKPNGGAGVLLLPHRHKAPEACLHERAAQNMPAIAAMAA